MFPERAAASQVFHCTLSNCVALLHTNNQKWTALDVVLSHLSSKADHTAWYVVGYTAETGALQPQIGGPGSASPSKLDKIAEAAAAAVMRKQSQVPVVAGIVKSANAWDTSGDISVTIYPACKAHAHAPGSCCSQVCHATMLLFHTLSAPVLVALQSVTTPPLDLLGCQCRSTSE